LCDSIAYFTEESCWLAKNSDREPDEPQLVEWHESFLADEVQQTTYLQVKTPVKRYATWLSRPEWMWGAEMGVNEHGVAIANEAVFTRLVNKKSESLLGMDLLRLALEQSQSADEGLSVITRYLSQYGQGGKAGFKNKAFYYDNSFLIVDASGGWQLETAGQFWVAKKLSREFPILAISNKLTIESDFDRCSDDLLDKSIQAGHWNGKGSFNFKKIYGNWFMSWAGCANKRRSCNREKLVALDNQQAIAPQLAAILRQHKKGNTHSSNADVCMHATGILRPSQTTQSMISQLSTDTNKSWMTGGSAPCVSLFKPLQQASNSWLIQHSKFWQDWNVLYLKSESDKRFRSRLQNYNLSIESKLWNADENDTLIILDDWWESVQYL